MKEKHLIALDLDGTLLTDKKTISPASKKIVQQLIEEGHIVVIATGRSNRLSILYYNELGLQTPLINSNGAVLHNPFDNSWGSYHHPLKHDTAMEIVETCYDLNSENILAAVHDDVYLDSYDEAIANFYGVKNGQFDHSFVVGNVKQHLKENPTLMLLYPDADHVDTLTNRLNELETEIVDHRNWGEPFHVIEVMNKQMNKAEALKQVANYYGIPKHRIVAFGDGSNDLEMIDYAGVGVAMTNGLTEIKQVAKYVTDTNENDGVANFLTEYFKTTMHI
ncbi:MAG TPA: Cof-type HAD-IIB family hydrolase [Pseudogracilibacillus sp.]|nr:Cof-type HAD-IIB family hydrolase [Pseudogracilibacillus sp.]